MLASYLTIAARQLLQYKLHSVINVLGLSIGLAACILIALFVQFERGYDRQFGNVDRIYRVSRDFYPSDEHGRLELHLATNAPQMAPLLKLDFPQIEEAARINCCGNVVLSSEDKALFEDGLALADNAIFKIFDFRWIEGDPADALAAPFTLVLTETAARRYFGETDPMGRTLLVEDRYPAKVTGVIEDLPENTHLHFNALLSLETAEAVFGRHYLEDWSSNNFYTYVLLKKGDDIGDVRSGSAAFFNRRLGPGASKWTGYTVTALADIHLHAHRDMEMSAPGSTGSLYAMAAIAAFILLIACINFMNLTTARSAQRAKEIGLRKAVGASRGRLARQFLGETALVALIAAVVALVLVRLALPVFGAYVQRDLSLQGLGEPRFLASLGALILIVAALAGSYPAFYLSAFEPARVLKGDLTRGQAAGSFRKVLVVVQFSIAIALIIGTAIVMSQMRFARNVELGLDKAHIVVLNGSPTAGLGSEWEALKQRLLAYPEITSVTASDLVPGQRNTDSFTIRTERGRSTDMAFMRVDFGFFQTYGIETLAGRVFSEDFGDRATEPSDVRPWAPAAFVLNQLAARELGWTPEQAVGKVIRRYTGDDRGFRGPVVGVVANASFESIRNARKPMLFYVPAAQRVDGLAALRQASVRITGSDVPGTLRYIEKTWTELLPNIPVSHRFLDDDFEALYMSETRQGELLAGFAVLAVLIACLGLFALASFTTERRTKEIGVRKALGSGAWDVVKLFTSETTALVLTANVLAWPAAYVLMQRWLMAFAYRVDMSLLVYLASSLLALAIAWVTVAWVAARAANVNPASALRYE